MPPGQFMRSKSNANPLRRSTPTRRPAAGGNGTSGSTKRGPNVLGVGGTAAKNGSVLSSNSNDPNPGSNYTNFKLRCCTTDEVKDLRHHIMKFHSKTHIDPAESFTPPVRLHRKDPRNMQTQLTLAELEDRRKRGLGDHDFDLDMKMEDEPEDEKFGLQVKTETGVTEGTGEKNADDKGKNFAGPIDKNKPPAEQVDLSLIAPDGGARRAKINPFQKKTRQVILGDVTARKLRYEEHYPWVMEDFDGQNTWVGNYEAGQADSFVLFVFDKDGFKMVPAEKYYKMTPRNKYQTLSAEEAEKRMQKGEQPNRWVMKYFPGEGEEAGAPGPSTSKPTNARSRFRTTDNSLFEEDSIRREEDQEEIDFDEEFADDEEAPIMDGNEEDVKEVEKKVKKELRSDAADVRAEESEEEEDQKMDKTGLKLIKSLRSLEKNGNYDSDEDINPYATEESSDEEPDSAESAVKEEGKEKDPSAPGSLNVGVPGVDTAKKEKKEKKLKKDKLKNKKKKKASANLPVGMVILQLSSSVLGSFPPSVWNPTLKRRRIEETGEEDTGPKGPKTKKIKVKSEPLVAEFSPMAIKAASPSPPISSSTPTNSLRANSPAGSVSKQSSSDGSASKNTGSEPTDADLITEEDVASIIRSRQVTAKELLHILKPKLRKHPRNNQLLKALVPRIAKLSDKFLVLKDQ